MAQVYRLPQVKKARAKANKPEPIARQWTCKRCKHDIGVETSAAIQISRAPRIKGLRIIAGSKEWVCAHCWKRDIITPLM